MPTLTPPTLSIVTVTYQDPRGLRATLESLRLIQKSEALQSWEVLVIDSSPEKNEDVRRHFEGLLPFQWIEQVPRGIYSAQNLGLEKAQGEWIWFLNGGDRLTRGDVLEKMIVEGKRTSNCSAVIAGVQLFKQGIRVYSQIPEPDFRDNLFWGNRICHQAMIYRREVFQRLGDFDLNLRLASDYDHHWRMVVAGEKVHCLSEILVDYELGGASSHWKKSLQEFYQVFKRHSPSLAKNIRYQWEAALLAEGVRLLALKSLAVIPGSGILRPVWNQWKEYRCKTQSR